MRLHEKLRFEDVDFDDFLLAWLEKGLEGQVLKEWEGLLVYEAKFREELCDFLRALREDAWVHEQRSGE